MKRTLLIILAASVFAVSTSANAGHNYAREYRASDSFRGFSGTRFYNWTPVARDELILWASPSRPYLVKIWRPYTSLRFAHRIGVTSTAGRISKFDRVIVDGQRLPIRSIVALDRKAAKKFRRKQSKHGR